MITSNREPVEWLGLRGRPAARQSEVDRLESAAHEHVLYGVLPATTEANHRARRRRDPASQARPVAPVILTVPDRDGVAVKNPALLTLPGAWDGRVPDAIEWAAAVTSRPEDQCGSSLAGDRPCCYQRRPGTRCSVTAAPATVRRAAPPVRWRRTIGPPDLVGIVEDWRPMATTRRSVDGPTVPSVERLRRSPLVPLPFEQEVFVATGPADQAPRPGATPRAFPRPG